MKKTAVIIWVWWQDWKILWDFLKWKDYNIIWIWRKKNTYIWIEDNEIIHTDILNKLQVNRIIEKYKPNELYYFAAYHHSSQDIQPNEEELFTQSTQIHVNGYFNFLNAIKEYSINTKVCYTSSCLIYWWSETDKQNEWTKYAPNSIYAITKLEWMNLWNYFAEKYNLRIVNAILYNHESEYREEKFLTMKIIKWAINISKWLQDKIILWDISKKVDWWYALDYIEAMYLLLQENKKWDYIISSWKLHTISNFIKIVFNYFNLDWEKYVIVNNNIIQRNTWILFWDNMKILNDIWWKPKIWFEEMIIKIIEKTL